MLQRIMPATYAPVISAIPKNVSAAYAINKHNARPIIGILLVCGYFASNNLNNLYAITPPIPDTAKNITVFMTTLPTLESGVLSPITKVRTIIPITSSITAALTIVVPILPLRCPISRSA